jgi:hypothetical protein
MELERGKLTLELDQTHRMKTVEAAELASVRAELEGVKERLVEARREMSR